MLRKPGHKPEKVLFILSLVLVLSGIAFVLMHLVDVFLISSGLGLYLLLALFTYWNLSMRRKPKNTEKEMDIIGISPDQVYDALLSFFSKKHGYNRMQVLYSSKPALIAVKLNSWMGMVRGFNRPPGSVKLQINPSNVGSKIQFKFDFSGFCNAIYGAACILMVLFASQIFGVIRAAPPFPLLLVSLGMNLFLLIALLQVPFVSTLEVKTYLRGKIRECLTKSFQKTASS